LIIYPVDHRHTAIMHISNHLSFFIFHHVAIFPEKFWPKIITLIEPVIIEGQKMGKSKGNIIPLSDIQDKYSADLFRFYISHSADLGIYMDWREKKIQSVRNHINRFYNFMSENISSVKTINLKFENIKSKYAKVILSKIIRYFIEADDALKEFNIRRYLQISFYEMFNLMQEFKKTSVDDNDDFFIVFKITFRDWLKIISLTLPHLCEELWEQAGMESFISKSLWSDFNQKYINKQLEIEYGYILNLIDDILSIKKIVKSRKYDAIHIYTASIWKYEVMKHIFSHKGDFTNIVNEIKEDSELLTNTDVIPFIKIQIKNRIWEKDLPQTDEIELLEQYKRHIEKKVNMKIIINSDYDPKLKSSKAIPYKPAIYIDI